MQPSELIAILALVVALVGPVTTWRIARDRNDHESRQAAEARTQQRREALYVDLMDYAAA